MMVISVFKHFIAIKSKQLECPAQGNTIYILLDKLFCVKMKQSWQGTMLQFANTSNTSCKISQEVDLFPQVQIVPVEQIHLVDKKAIAYPA